MMDLFLFWHTHEERQRVFVKKKKKRRKKEEKKNTAFWGLWQPAKELVRGANQLREPGCRRCAAFVWQTAGLRSGVG
jgi:hypothetical protein